VGHRGAGPCITEFDELIEHNLRFRIRPFEMVTIAAEFPDQEAAVKDFLVKKHASTKNYIFASDNKDELSEAWTRPGKARCPTPSSSTRKGKVIYREMGSINFLKMRRAIVPALNALKAVAGPVPIPPNLRSKPRCKNRYARSSSV
jgi:hypothetical protein